MRTIAWLRSRRISAGFHLLSRAKSDPSPRVRAEALLGLAEIAPECAIDDFRLRTLPESERAQLIERAAGEGLMTPASLRTIARDGSASPRERTEALIALAAMGERVDPERWIPLLRAPSEDIRLIAALSVVSDTPATRSVALAQQFAMESLKLSVREASNGQIAEISRVLRMGRTAPSASYPDWCAALLSACRDRSPEHALIRREALGALLLAQPGRPGLERLMTSALAIASDPNADRRMLAYWALKSAHRYGAGDELKRLASTLARDARPHGFLACAAVTIREIAEEGHPQAATLGSLARSGGELGFQLAVDLAMELPVDDRADALRALLPEAAGQSREAMRHRCAQELVRLGGGEASLDEAIGAGRDFAEALVLAGAWSPACEADDRLVLLRSLREAEGRVEGSRTAERAALADRLVLILEDAGFDPTLRAEAAWLALVLRDQSSEALARLPRVPRNPAQESRPGGHEADSLGQWVQMPYP